MEDNAQSQRILILGDGNFSFTLSLTNKLQKQTSNYSVISTSYDSYEDIKNKYPDAAAIISTLQTHSNIKIVHNINASTSLKQNMLKSRIENAALHSNLLGHIFHSLDVLADDGIFYLALTEDQRVIWKLDAMAERNHFELIETVLLLLEQWPGYEMKRHHTGKSFASRVQSCKLYWFCFRRKVHTESVHTDNVQTETGSLSLSSGVHNSLSMSLTIPRPLSLPLSHSHYVSNHGYGVGVVPVNSNNNNSDNTSIFPNPISNNLIKKVLEVSININTMTDIGHGYGVVGVVHGGGGGVDIGSPPPPYHLLPHSQPYPNRVSMSMSMSMSGHISRDATGTGSDPGHSLSAVLSSPPSSSMSLSTSFSTFRPSSVTPIKYAEHFAKECSPPKKKRRITDATDGKFSRVFIADTPT
eukprot:gene5460-10977_t